MHPNIHMATLTIKNLPDEIYTSLTKLAKQNRRSINSEAIVHLERLRFKSPRQVEAELEDIRKLRESMKDVYVTEADIAFAKNEGRA